MNERHDDLQEIIDAALREMAAEEDGAHPLPCEDGQGTRVQGPAPREQREEGRAGRARRSTPAWWTTSCGRASPTRR